MGKLIHMVLITMLLTSVSGSFSFFGFGSHEPKTPNPSELMEAASSSTASRVVPYLPTSITNILFGTGTGSGSESGSGSGGSSGLLSFPSSGGGATESQSAYGGSSLSSPPAEYGGSPQSSTQAFGNGPSLPPAYGNAPASSSSAGNAPASPPSYGNAPASPPSYGNAPALPPAYGNAPALPPAYGNVPALPPAYGNAHSPPAPYGNAPASLSPPGPVLPPPSPYNNNPQAQAQNQNQGHPSSAVPQSNPTGMPLYSPNLPSNMAAHPSRLPLFNSGNAESYLSSPGTGTNTLLYHIQPNMGHGHASHDIQTSNGMRFNEETRTHANPTTGNTGKMTTKTGSFSWLSPEGQQFDVQYVADAQGRQTGSQFPASPNVADSLKSSPGQYGPAQNYGPPRSSTSGVVYTSSTAIQSPPSTSYGSSASAPTYAYSSLQASKGEFSPSQPVPSRPSLAY